MTVLIAQTNFEKYMITITVMLVTVIEVLDMTIVNVALTPMMGSLGANSEQITWVLTSYIVSAAIFMPLTGFLVNRIGQKRLLIFNIIGFLIASILCGIATSLPEIVFFRILQGIFGAGLVPLSQTILRTTYTKKELGKAMAVWSIGIMVAPVLGPTLGGYITDHFTWRWIFYINAPVCILAFFMTLQFIKETPKVMQQIDWLGLTLMVLGIGCLQIFLDQGNHYNWFASKKIVILAFVATICLSTFIIRGMKIDNNIVNIKLYKNKNFAISSLLITLFSGCILGVLSLQPILLENFVGYSSELTGYLMAPRGIVAAIGMMFAGKFVAKFDPRKIMVFGLGFAILGTYSMSQLNLQAQQWSWIWTGAIQGLGMGLFFVPLATMSLYTLEQENIAAASGLFSFARNIGTSLGISLLSTLVTRESQINWNRLGAHINPFNPNLHHWLAEKNWHLHDPVALKTLSEQLMKQAGAIAFLDAFWLIAIVLILIAPFVFILQRPVED